jgi:hypothetical protein
MKKHKNIIIYKVSIDFFHLFTSMDLNHPPGLFSDFLFRREIKTDHFFVVLLCRIFSGSNV